MARQKERPIELETITVAELADYFAKSFANSFDDAVRQIVRDELRRQTSKAADSEVAS